MIFYKGKQVKPKGIKKAFYKGKLIYSKYLPSGTAFLGKYINNSDSKYSITMDFSKIDPECTLSLIMDWAVLGRNCAITTTISNDYTEIDIKAKDLVDKAIINPENYKKYGILKTKNSEKNAILSVKKSSNTYQIVFVTVLALDGPIETRIATRYVQQAIIK